MSSKVKIIIDIGENESNAAVVSRQEGKFNPDERHANFLLSLVIATLEEAMNFASAVMGGDYAMMKPSSVGTGPKTAEEVLKNADKLKSDNDPSRN